MVKEAVQYLKALVKDETYGNEYLQNFSVEEQYKILLTVKYALAYDAIKHGTDMSGACYDCKYRRNIPGDNHSLCTNRLAVVIGDENGRKNGWFFHPINFDPIWLRYCDGYEKIKPD